MKEITISGTHIRHILEESPCITDITLGVLLPKDREALERDFMRKDLIITITTIENDEDRTKMIFRDAAKRGGYNPL